MRPEQIHAQRETDEEILRYVRGLQGIAPVRADAVERYLTRARGRRIDGATLTDRLRDLVQRGYLQAQREFLPGEGWSDDYLVTPAARAALDGAAPWDWER